jgi:hypothetical protein
VMFWIDFHLFSPFFKTTHSCGCSSLVPHCQDRASTYQSPHQHLQYRYSIARKRFLSKR